VLSVAEEHGSSRASYALKLLLSEGRLAIASTGKESASGRLVTRSYETAGPLALLMTTTATNVDPELENRLVVLGVNEDQEQTAAIIAAQRRDATLEGIRARRSREALRARHTHVQRLLAPMPVVIDEFTAPFPSTATRHRRDHAKVLSLISAIALLHQHQREQRPVLVGDEYVTFVVAEPEDVERGVELAAKVLSRDVEALAPQARRLLGAIRDYVAAAARRLEIDPVDVGVTRRELRELLGWSDTQVRGAADRLVALEYLVVTPGGRGRCRTYRLVPEFPLVRQSNEAPVVRNEDECGGVRAVRPPGPRTSRPSSSGETDQLAQLVPPAASPGTEMGGSESYVGEDQP